MNILLRSLLVLLLFNLNAHATVGVPAPPSIEGSAHILIDYDSGRIISEKNADQPVEPASLTKMMTTYVVYDELKHGRLSLQDQVLVSEKAWRMGGSKMFIRVDTRVSVKELLKGVVIQSGNDASVALAEHVAGGEDAFASLMNKHAARLGLTSTHFVNSTGWPAEGHLTTARDMALLGLALIRDFPEYYPSYAEKEFVYNDIKQQNRNRLLWRDPSVDGIKTGHTEAAGFCLVASAKRNDMRLIAAVMGTSSKKARNVEAHKLLNYGFRFYETHQLYAAGTAVDTLPVWKGAADSVAVGLEQPLWVTIPRGRKPALEAEVQTTGKVIAPVAMAASLATLNIRLDDATIATRPLHALHAVAEGGIVKRLVDHIKLMLE